MNLKITAALVTLCGLFIVSQADDLSKAAYCAGCQATVKELVMEVMHPDQAESKKSAPQRVVKAMNGVCKQKLDTFDFPAQKITAGCKKVLSIHGKDLEKMLKKAFEKEQSPPAATTANTFCFNKTKICEGLEEKYLKTHQKRDNFDADELMKMHGDKVKHMAPVKEEL